MRTQRITITGDTPHADVIGLRVRVNTHSAGPLVGVVERVECVRPVVRFPDGRWAYGTPDLDVVDEV